MMISNMAAGNVLSSSGLKGKSINVVTACATGSHSIGEAYPVYSVRGCGCDDSRRHRSIYLRDRNRRISGADHAFCPQIPIAVPFLLIRSGMGLSWERERQWWFWKNWNMQESGEPGFTGKSQGTEQPAMPTISQRRQMTGRGERARAMELALKEGGLEKEALTYINAHGTSTHHNDLFETRAIKKLFGEHAYRLKINSTKSIVGHMLVAAGAIECIACFKQMEEAISASHLWI